MVEVGGWRVEVGGWRVEGGGWMFEVGGWRVEIGDWRLEVGGSWTIWSACWNCPGWMFEYPPYLEVS